MAWERPRQLKFSALNVDFSNLSSNPLRLKWSSHPGVKEVYPLKVVVLSLLARLALADRYRLAAYRNNKCRQVFKWFNINDLKRF